MAAHPVGLLFPSRRGHAIDANYLAKVIRAAKKRLGLTAKWTPYSFRHSFIVRHLERTRDIYSVSTWAGDSIKTVETYYAKAAAHARSTRHLLEGGDAPKSAG